MRVLVLIACLLAWAPRLWGESQASPLSLLELPESESLLLGRRVSIWENKGENARLEDVFEGRHESSFKASTLDFPGPGFIRGELWLKITLHNPLPAPKVLILESRYALTDFISVYQKNPSGIFQGDHRGDSSRQKHENSAFRSPVFEIVAQPGDNTYYLQTHSQGPNILAIYLWHTDSFKIHSFIDTLVVGCLFGFLSALFFYNSFLAVSFNSRTYAFYSLFLLIMILLQMSMQNIWPYIVSQDLAIWLDNRGYLVIASATNFLALMVTIFILYMKKNLPRTLKLFKWLLVLSIVVPTLGLLVGFDVHTRIVSVMVASCSLSMIVACILAMLQGYRPAAYYLVASLSFMAANILVALNSLGVYHSTHVTQYGNFFGIVIQGLLMSLAIGDRVNFIRAKADKVIRELNQELQTHLAHVEALVAERTETIRTILDNVASGFVIVDQEGRVMEGFSQACHTLLNQKVQEGQIFAHLLQMPAEDLRVWNVAWSQVFQDTLPLDVSLSQLPSAIQLGKRNLKLEAKALRGLDGSIRHILFTLHDVTELSRKQRESRNNRTLIKILRNLEAFRQFVNHSHEFVERLKVCKDKREQAFLLHTLKGNSLVFGMKSVAGYLHQLEEGHSLTSEHITAVEKLFSSFLSNHASILKTPWGISEAESRVTKTQLQTLQTLMERQTNQALRREVEIWMQDLLAKSVSTMVQPMLDSCRSTARKLGKNISFEMVGGDARVRSRQEEKTLEFLIHIIRNAVVHGIEADRVALGKPEEGHIRLEFKEDARSLSVFCTDDGQGFDRQHWEDAGRALKLQGTQDLSTLPLAELVELVSRGGFSTHSEVSQVAGRGVGLEGVLQAIKEFGGRVSIESQPGKGSRFHIELQRQAVERLEEAS